MTFRLLLIVFFTLLIALLSKVYFSLSANKAQDSNHAQDLKTEKPETTIGFKTEAMSSPDNLDKNQCLDQSTVHNHIMALSEKADVIFKSLSGKNNHRSLSLSLLYYFYTENSENLRLIRMPYDNNTVSHIDYPASDYAMATLAERNQLTLSLAQGDFSRIGITLGDSNSRKLFDDNIPLISYLLQGNSTSRQLDLLSQLELQNFRPTELDVVVALIKQWDASLVYKMFETIDNIDNRSWSSNKKLYTIETLLVRQLKPGLLKKWRTSIYPETASAHNGAINYFDYLPKITDKDEQAIIELMEYLMSEGVKFQSFQSLYTALMSLPESWSRENIKYLLANESNNDSQLYLDSEAALKGISNHLKHLIKHACSIFNIDELLAVKTHVSAPDVPVTIENQFKQLKEQLKRLHFENAVINLERIELDPSDRKTLNSIMHSIDSRDWNKAISMLQALSDLDDSEYIYTNLLDVAMDKSIPPEYAAQFLQAGAQFRERAIVSISFTESLSYLKAFVELGVDPDYVNQAGLDAVSNLVYNSLNMGVYDGVGLDQTANLKYLLNLNAGPRTTTGGLDALNLALSFVSSVDIATNYIGILLQNGFTINDSHIKQIQTLKEKDANAYNKLVSDLPALAY